MQNEEQKKNYPRNSGISRKIWPFASGRLQLRDENQCRTDFTRASMAQISQPSTGRVCTQISRSIRHVWQRTEGCIVLQ